MFDDEFQGQGGSYIVDKKGKRTLVERTADAAEQDQQTAEQPAENTEQTEG